MQNEFGLLINLSISLGLALVLGLVTERLRLSPTVGYLLAGILLGPKTPGFVADAKTARELAEIGVVLLMFGVGLHFDLHNLLSVRRIVGTTDICIEEAEMALGLAVLLLHEVGADEDRVREEIQRIRTELARIGGR
jgi:predicted Kef-type K+ transport protein